MGNLKSLLRFCQASKIAPTIIKKDAYEPNVYLPKMGKKKKIKSPKTSIIYLLMDKTGRKSNNVEL